MKYKIQSIALVIIPAVLLALPAFAQNPSLRVAPKDASISIADSYTLSIRVENAQNLGAFEFELALSSAIARIDSVRLGGFLGGTGRIAIPVGPSIDTTGSLTTLRFGGLTFGTAKGPSGGGVLAKVHLTALAGGATNLALQEALLTDVAGQTLNIATIVSGRLTVLSGQPDLALSSVFVSPDSLPADSVCWALLTVVPRDASGDTLAPGQVVSFTTTAGTLPGKIKGHPDGSYSQRLYAPLSPAIAQVTAQVNGVILPMRPKVVFYAPPVRRVALDPTARAVAPGDSFTLAVTADSVCDLGSFEVTFAFPTGRLRFQNADISGFLGSTGRTALSTPVRTWEQADATKVTVGGFSFGDERGPDGSGDLAFLHFKLSGVQPAEISITNVVLTTTEGKALSVARLSGSTITPLLQQADPVRSLIFVEPDSIPADGFSTATVTVVPVAANGDTLPAGVEINLTTTAGRWANAGTPHPNGTFTRTLVADVSPGVATIRATVNGVALARSARVVFFAAPEKFIRIAPSDTTVFLGKSFDMAIWAENVHELGSFEFLLQSLNSLIRIDSIRLGDFLVSTGRTAQSIGPDIRQNGDSTAARFGAYSFGKSKAPSGKGILALLRLTPLRLGEAHLNFNKAILANAAGQKIPGVTPENARIVIAPGAADPLLTSVFADPDTLIANGATFSQITVVPRNARGDTLPPCQQVEIQIQNGGGSWENDVVCHHDGAYTRILRSPATSGQAQISALVNAVQANQLATIVFLPSLETKLSIDPALTTVLVKNRFDVGIYLENIANLGGFELTVKFLSRIMAFEQARVGALLQNTGRTAVIIDSLYTIGPDTTALRLGVFSFGSQPGATGSGAVARVALRALQPGESVLAISNATLVNPAGERLALDRLQTGTVRVIAGVVDPVLSEVVAQPDSGAADDVFCSTITVVPRDTSGLPLGPGQNVRLSATPPGALAATIVDHNDGVYTQALCATLTSGVSQVTAVVNGVLLTQQPTVKFKPLPTIFAQPAAPFGDAGKTFEMQIGILGTSSIEEKIARLQFEIN
ncbi:MAG: invasin domain 3-containing protein, partial [bacterium]